MDNKRVKKYSDTVTACRSTPLRQHTPCGMCKFINAPDVSVKSTLKSRAARRGGEKPQSREGNPTWTALPRTVCLGSEARNTNYKLAAYGIAIFSPDWRTPKASIHTAVATLMWRTYQVDSLSMVSVEFLCKTADLYLRILHTYLEIEYNCVFTGIFLLPRKITFLLDPPSHKRVLSLGRSTRYRHTYLSGLIEQVRVCKKQSRM